MLDGHAQSGKVLIWQSGRVDDYKAVVVPILGSVAPDDWFEIDTVVGDKCSALLLRDLKEIGIAKASKA